MLNVPIPLLPPVIKAVFPRMSLPRRTVIAELLPSNFITALFFRFMAYAIRGSTQVVRLLILLKFATFSLKYLEYLLVAEAYLAPSRKRVFGDTYFCTKNSILDV